ncbi:glycosyltransferase family 2 protein [Samsonia erythrinae]|uniref:Glycosyltransferase involved in cell wall biosynthesis n=1 Tax=Samsonia erythrinae TaxID=160434 RepID=A0A4R3VSE4_9GAMM|nr:glycosyltransferase family 2 protein [Samsonia erythrinae]TCV08959.1 glycosyltransferase involved in cell wall biosynthesis [Samsonia erythrinae]
MSLVSIIMPTYNSESTLEESINSILLQTYNNWELIVTDDCSDDSTLEILKKFSEIDNRIKFFLNEKNMGAGFSRNKSIEAAKGDYIAFLDSDDLWLPEKLEKQINFMRNNNYALTYTAYKKIDEQGNVIGRFIPPMVTTYNKLLYSNVIGCLTAIYDVRILGKCFMPLIRKRQDMALWLSILKSYPAAYCLQEELALYRMSKNSISSNKFKILKHQWIFYRRVLGFSRIKSVYYFSVYAQKGLIKFLN